MSQRPDRRRFLERALALGSSLAFATAAHAEEASASPNEKVNLGVIGVAGRGADNLAAVSHENIVALCDVDLRRADRARSMFSKASFYEDYRRLLEQKNIDAVVISIPDHSHALAAISAMRSGKHVYCEKPLAHSVHEVRLMRETAKRNTLVTQMGTQIHAENNYRRVVEIVQTGTLGDIRRVHVWCQKRPTPGFRAKKDNPPPVGLNYDLWLGPAPYRPYHPSHLHFDWRWWWDFGGGMLADMACHYVDLPVWALNLGAPSRIAAIGKVIHEGDNDVPDLMQVEYQFPVRDAAPAVHLTWYHGVVGPDLSGKRYYPGFESGVLFEGEKGMLLADYGRHKLLPESTFKDFSPPKPTIPASIGHHREWLNAIKTGQPTTCNFNYGGALSEAVLLGNVAYRCGKELEWDASAGKVTNAPEAAAYMEREYRKGWAL
jgi:predicted dehydrogenase